MSEEVLERLRRIESDLAVIKVQMHSVEEKQREFQTGVNRGLWLVGGGFIAAIISFIAKGGLNNGS
jgi:hypothetical protein